MQYLHIQPLDPVFFRNGKPFTKGEDSVGDSAVLPTPSVIWGSMFSTLLSYHYGLVSSDDIEKLRIENIYLYNSKAKEVLVPAPLDIFIDDKKRRYTQSYISSNHFIHSANSMQLISPLTKEEVENANNRFIKLTDLMRHYPYKDKYPSIELYDVTSFSKPYVKIGIDRSNDTRTTDDAALYRLEMIEYAENWGFIVSFDCATKFPEKGILKLGGEGKMATFNVIDEPYDLTTFKNELSKDKFDLVKVYFETATFIANTLDENLGKQGITIEAKILGKPISIGGFDIKLQEPKAMKRALPAGSIWVVSSENEQTIEEWKGRLSAILKNDNKNGFGSFQIIPIHEIN